MEQPTIIVSPLKAAISAQGGYLDLLVRVQAPDLPTDKVVEHTPKRLALVVDRSGSMQGKPLREALRCVMHIAMHDYKGQWRKMHRVQMVGDTPR